MNDSAIRLDNRPGVIAEMGETLAKAGVSVEGGSAWGSGRFWYCSLTKNNTQNNTLVSML